MGGHATGKSGELSSIVQVSVLSGQPPGAYGISPQPSSATFCATTRWTTPPRCWSSAAWSPSPSTNDRTVRESALNSISEAFNHYRLPRDLFTALVPAMAAMEPELLGHTLYILGATQDPAAAVMIRPLLGHSDASVREEAALALTEIPQEPAPKDAITHNT